MGAVFSDYASLIAAAASITSVVMSSRNLRKLERLRGEHARDTELLKTELQLPAETRRMVAQRRVAALLQVARTMHQRSRIEDHVDHSDQLYAELDEASMLLPHKDALKLKELGVKMLSVKGLNKRLELEVELQALVRSLLIGETDPEAAPKALDVRNRKPPTEE